MKLLIKLFALSLALMLVANLVSCTSLDVMVDKSQLKAETATHAIYPSTAVSPVINADAVNTIINEQLAKANQSLKEATK